MFPTTRTPATAGRTALVLVALAALLLSLFSFARPAIANHTIVGVFESVATTGQGANECPGFDFGYKIDISDLAEGTHTYTSEDGVFTVTLTYDTTDESVSFSGASPAVSRFIVKGGNVGPDGGRTITNYTPPVTSGGPSSPPGGAGVSHVTFCGFTPPSITVDKTGDTLSKVGDLVSYTVTITNTSATKTAYKVSITDTLAGSLTSNAGCGASLAPLGSCTINYTYTVPAGAADPLLNTVTAVYSSQAGGAGGVATVSDGHSVQLFQPSISVVKTGPETAEVGETVTYTVTITNTGSADSPNLVIDSVIDTLAGNLTAAVITQCGELAVVSDVCVFTYTYTIPDADPDPLLNTVTVHTHPAGFPNDIWASDGHSVDFEFGEIIVVKDDLSDSGEGFSFEATYDEDGFTLSDDGINAGDEDRNESGQIAAGHEYDITEILEGDWELISLVCVGTLAEDGSTFEYVGATASVLLANGDTVTCTFTNDLEDTGSISITKVEECEECDALTIGYWFNAAGSHDEETDALLADGIVADGIEFNSADEVREYRADDISGESDGQPGLSARGQLTLQYLATQLNVLNNGEDCDLASRIYNNPDSPLDGMTVAEILAEADLAFDDESEFSDEDIQEALNDINNSAHVEENPLTCAAGDEGAVLEGAKFDVYFDTDDSGTKTAADVKVGELETGADGTATIGDLPLGTYFLVETAAPEGCDILEDPIEVTLTENEPDAEVTIENDCEGGGGEEDKGSITIIKDAIPDDAQDFAFTVTGAGLSAFSLDDDADGTLPRLRTFEELDPGAYSVTESDTAGWTLTGIVCSAGGTANLENGIANITLVAGANVTCTFTNEQDEEEKGSITIIKNAIPDDAQDFMYTVTGVGLSIFSLDDDADGTLPNIRTFGDLDAGTYTVTEVPAGGWTVTSVTCSAGGTGTTASRLATIELAAGAHVTCTFVNTKDTVQGPLGSITILKNAIPDDAQDFGFTTTGAGLSSFSLDDDADPALSNQRSFTGLAAGSYSVTETAVAGWTLTSVTCSTGGTVNAATPNLASITLAAGANVTCTFVNTKQGSGTAGSTSPQGSTSGVPNTSTFDDAELFGGSTVGVLVAVATIGGLMALATVGLLSANAARGRRRR